MALETPVPDSGFQLLAFLEDREARDELRDKLREHAGALMNSFGLQGPVLRNGFADDAIRYVAVRGQKGASNPDGLAFANRDKLLGYCRDVVWSQIQQYIRDDYNRRVAETESAGEAAGSVHGDDDSFATKSPEAVLTERAEIVAELLGKKEAHIRASISELLPRLTPAARARFEEKYRPALHYPEVWRECSSGVPKISPNGMQKATGVPANLVTKDFKQLEAARETLSKEGRLSSSFRRQMRGWDEK